MQRGNIRIKNITKIAGICGILIPVVIFTFIGLAMMHSPWFEWEKNALSDLGIDGISAFFFNYGMIIGGILVLIFSIGLMRFLSNKAGAYVLCASSLALVGIGLVPETMFLPHLLTSASFFILLTLSFMIIGLTNKNSKFEKSVGMLAIFFAFLAIISIFFIIPLDGVAIPESMSCFPAFIWCMITGTKMVIS